MPDVAVVTDSTSALPTTLCESLGITVVSMYYDIDGSASPEGGHEVPGRGMREAEFDGDFGRFFAELDASKSVATTSPPTLEDLITVFERLLQDHSAVFSVILGSNFSPACSLAREAAAQIESERGGGSRLGVMDSAGTAGFLGVQAIAAARAAAAGADLEGVIEQARQARQEVRMWFILDTLEYIRRGGRIGTAAAWIGSALDLKPIMAVESEMKAVERVRTRRRAVERLFELMRQRRAVGADRWFINHASAYEDAMQLADHLRELFGSEPEFVCEVGPVLATHAGPGMLGVGSLPGTAMGYALG
ncbi:DegV family protein [Mycobacterium sp. 1164985.4]|uniref:DegV family protein n=1 Tax=Mycobacterium sp. 1164985.4 TaxID=1834069 RepID=UPI0007FC3F30|nr:DegV family protein [Mycobacterium sp. 1164985.4]OBK79220.1 hypothetical protein A5650_08385 [Mycobacterium sp. 1164985.4]